MRKILAGITVAILAVAGRAPAGTFFGALSNFDAVNDTGSPCNGFEIELECSRGDTRDDINHDGRVNLVDVLIVIMPVGRPC